MIKTILPNNELLKKYIECFYWYEGNADSIFNYVAFPHYNTGLSFFKGSSLKREQWKIVIEESIDARIHIEILGKYTSPVLIEYKGKIQEISIVFKPLGINRFIRESYLSIAPKFSQEFNNITWNHRGESLFSVDNSFAQLESFLLTQYEDDPEFYPIEKSLDVLSDLESQVPISIVASRSGLSPKTFQRHFKKLMGCSPIEYRRICRFRTSLQNKLSNAQLKNLTDLTYDSGYFDQSYLIKEFRKLTNHNPKEFFRSVSKVDGDKIIWEVK